MRSWSVPRSAEDPSTWAGTAPSRVRDVDPRGHTRRFLKARDEVFAYLHGLVRDPGVADDLLQETWLTLVQAARRGVEIKDVGRWCRGVARNLVLKHWRADRRSGLVVDSGILELVDRAYDEQSGNEEEWTAARRALRRCVRVLPNKSKRLLRMKYAERRTARAIAGSTGCSESSILMTLSRIRKALAHCIQRRLRASDPDQ